jgi:hypothetical protein
VDETVSDIADFEEAKLRAFLILLDDIEVRVLLYAFRRPADEKKLQHVVACLAGDRRRLAEAAPTMFGSRLVNTYWAILKKLAAWQSNTSQ